MAKQSKKAAAEAVASQTPVEFQKPFDPGVPPITNTGDITEQERVQEALLPPPSWGEAVGAAVRQETIVDSAVKSYVDRSFAPDADFVWTDADWAEATKGLKPEYQKHLLRARSKQHALWIRGNIDQELEDANTLQRTGAAENIGLRLGASILDPGQALLALATGPLAASTKASRIANIFRSGLAAGVTNAATEGFLANQQATRDGTDVFEAGLLGFIIGAPLGALSKAENAAMRSAAADGYEKSLLGRVRDTHTDEVKLTDAGEKRLESRKAPEVIYVDSEGRAVKQSDRVIYVDRAGRASDNPNLDAADDALWIGDYRKQLRAETDQRIATMRAEGKQRALDSARLTLKGEIAKARERMVARDEAEARLPAPGEEEGTVARGEGTPATPATLATPTAAAAGGAPALPKQPSGQSIAAAEHGDTVFFSKGEEHYSGRVHNIDKRGRVMIEDDATGKLVVFDPKSDPEGFESGIATKADDTAFKRGSAGSAQAGDVEVPETKMYSVKLGRFEIPLRWDYYAIFMRSRMNALKKLASDVIADPVGNADKSLARGASATEIAEMTRLKFEKRFLSEFEENFADYFKRVRPGIMGADAARTDFADAITRIVRGDTQVAKEFPEAAKVAAEVRAVHSELLDLAKKHGVEGADMVEPNPEYMMRKFNHDRIRMIGDKYDEAGIEQFLAAAIHSARSITGEDALKVARNYWKAVSRMQYDPTLSEALFGPKQYFHLRESLAARGIDKDSIEEVVEAVSGHSMKTEGDHARLKHRTVMDELFTANVATKEGGEAPLSISDLFINDSRLLVRQYAKQMSGLVGFARSGIKSEADWTRRLDEVRDEAHAKGLDPAKLKKHLGYMQDIRNYALGRPMAGQEFGTLDRVLRVLRDVNFIRNMGQAGFAQVPEIGNVLGLVGMRAFKMHVPSFGDLITHAKAGVLDDALARDLINMGLGGDGLSVKPNLREIDDFAFDRQLSKIEHWAEKGKVLTAHISGLSAMDDALRTLASKAFVQKFSDYAQGFSKLGKKDLDRMAWAGIGEDNIDGIFKRLKEHTELGENGRVEGIKWEEWQAADPESFDAFNLAIFREARKAVQAPTIGETSPWMHSQIGKILTQFRSFTLVAWAKQGLHNLHYADASTAAAWGLSMLFAGAGYVAQSALNYAHDKEALDKRLGLGEIAKAAYQRAGFSSLTPAAWDTLMMLTRGEPSFAYGRTTGLGTGFLVGNPTYDLVTSKGLGTLQNVTRSIFDDQHVWTRKDVKSGLSLFMPNYLGVRNFVDAASQEFPARNYLQDHHQEQK